MNYTIHIDKIGDRHWRASGSSIGGWVTSFDAETPTEAANKVILDLERLAGLKPKV